MAQAGLMVDPRWEVTSHFDIDSSTLAAGRLLDLDATTHRNLLR